MILDYACQSLAEKIFQKLNAIDWNEYAQQVANIEQENTETARNTTVTYADGLKVSTYEKRLTYEDGTVYFRGPRIQYAFPLEMNGEQYQVVANKEIETYDPIYSFTLLKGGAKLAQASGGDCTKLEITADQTGAQLLEAALNALTGMSAHIREDKHILETTN